MFFEVKSISKDGHAYTMKVIVLDVEDLEEKVQNYFSRIGWGQYQYKIKEIKKLSSEELDEHLSKEEC